MKYDLISIGTASIDIYYKGKTLPFVNNHFYLSSGGKYFVDFFHQGIGGGATNVAIGAKKNGIRVALMAKIGNNSFKGVIIDRLKQMNISTSLCDFEDDYYNVSSIFLNGIGEKTVVNYRTPHQHYFEKESMTERMFNTRSVYIANMADAPLSNRIKLLKEYRARNIQIFMNLGVNDCRRPQDQIDDLIKQIDVLIVNAYEFADLVKTPLNRLNFKKVYVPQYWPILREKTIIITDGEKGSYGYHNNAIYFQKAIPPKSIIDTTGAGDGYTAAFIADYVCTGNVETAMKSGAEYSSRKLSHLGAN